MADTGAHTPPEPIAHSVRHVAMFTFRDGVSPSDIEALDAALRSLPDLVDEIEGFACGQDLGLAEGTWDYVVVADFPSTEAYLAYAGHPVHVAMIEDVVKPLVTATQRVQFAAG